MKTYLETKTKKRTKMKNLVALTAHLATLANHFEPPTRISTPQEPEYVFNIHKLSKKSYQCTMVGNPKLARSYLRRVRYTGKGSTPEQAKLNAIIASKLRK